MPRTYEPIASTTLSSATATVTFDNIPGTYTDLVLVSSILLASQSGAGPDIRVNSDMGSNYSSTIVYGDPGGAASTRTSSSTALDFMMNANTTSRGISRNQFMNYANTNVFKTVLTEYGFGTTAVVRGVQLWRSTSAITRLDIHDRTPDNFASGSTFSLFGIKAA